MPDNRHVYLRNPSGTNDGFKKTRNAQPDSEDEPELDFSKFPTEPQQQRLRVATNTFNAERQQRQQDRSIQVPAIIDVVVIYFFKVFNQSLTKEFDRRYGLVPCVFEDFNKTVYFEINNPVSFNLFVRHLEMYYSSSQDETYEGKEYNLISLIYNFKFLSGNIRLESVSNSISSINLIQSSNTTALAIFRALLSYLNEQGIGTYQTDFSPDIIEVSDLTDERAREIANNFDIVKTISSSRVERIRPGAFGNIRRDYGFTVTVPEGVPTIGIIDTGFFRIDPLRGCLADISYDLTNTAAYIDDLGHGTIVACLAALGEEFIQTIKDNYEAKAKIAVIKAIQNDNDGLDMLRLVDVIRQAHTELGIRIFNLSLNEPLHKTYNKHISNYAYLLDKLAFENDLLFFISVGNIQEQRLRELIVDEPHDTHAYPAIFYSLDTQSEIHSCESTNIAEPSESMNNISIGAIAGNLEEGLTADITPAEELPAYYTRKFHYDYSQQINGSPFMRSQKNKHLNKPDLVFEGGDLFRFEAGIEVLRSPIEQDGPRFFSRSAGTSLSTPLVASYAASTVRHYPTLKMQSIKALLINAAESPCGNNPPQFRTLPKQVLRKLIGFGRPQGEFLITTSDNSITFVIEDEIEVNELRTIPISIPAYINRSGNKLNFKSTLCYSFRPIKDNHLAYLPLQITFGIFQPIEAQTMATMKTEDYRIKDGMSWSDDFFGIENRLFSNVQQRNDNVSGQKIGEIGNLVSLAIKCAAKKEIPTGDLGYIENTSHKFSFVLTITELPISRASDRLYADMVAINTIEAIADAQTDATAEAES